MHPGQAIDGAECLLVGGLMEKIGRAEPAAMLMSGRMA